MASLLRLSTLAVVLCFCNAAQVISLQSLTPHTTLRLQQPFRDFLGFNRRPITPRVFGRECSGKRNVRTYSGYCNNELNPLWGASKTPFLLKSTHIVFSLPTLPNPRVISNTICRDLSPTPNKRGMSELVTFFGQFIDHTVTETENTDIAWPIPIPSDDPVFTKGGIIPFFRTRTEGSGVNKSPVNSLSSYVDAVSVYGTNEEDVKKLRTMSGGRMRLSAEGFLTKDADGFFVSGDARVNENPLLTSMHTLFTREHNKVVAEVAAAFPTLNDEDTFQLARAIVGAEVQAVVYHEFLPAVLGHKLRAYTGYKTYIKCAVSSEFSTVGFRVGHTLINGGVTSIDAHGKKNVRMLRNAFFKPAAFLEDGVDNLFRGMMRTRAAEVDAQVTEEVRDFLVDSGPERTMQLDLAALNVQRGRDHAVPSYNTLRSMYRLPPVRSFSQITSDASLQKRLQQVYGTVGRIDPWIGGISEDHASGSLGALFGRIWEDEFIALRDGDRFYFEKNGLFTAEQIAKIPTLKALVGDKSAIGNVMRNVLLRNTALKANEVKKNPFFV